MSLLSSLDAGAHLRLGQALAPLRDEGVLIIGSGMSWHNMRGYGNPRSTPISAAFDAWLTDAVTRPAHERNALLADWERAEVRPGAASRTRRAPKNTCCRCTWRLARRARAPGARCFVTR